MRKMLRRALVAGAALSVLAASPGMAAAAGDDYPYRNDAPGQPDQWGFTTGECVSFIAWRLNQAGLAFTNDGWNDAEHWDERAAQLGYTVTSTPAIGAIAQWNPGEETSYTRGNTNSNFTNYFTAGARGHVALVQSINSDGSINVEQYNAMAAPNDHEYSTATVGAPEHFLYIHNAPPGPNPTGVNPLVKLSQTNSGARVTLRLQTYASSAGGTAYFFRRSGMTGKVAPYGTAIIGSNGVGMRVFQASKGQILAIYSHDTVMANPSGYSNTISFKVN